MTHTSEVYEFVRRKRVRCENISDTLRVKIETFVQSFEKLVVPLQMLLDASRARDEMKTDDVVRVSDFVFSRVSFSLKKFTTTSSIPNRYVKHELRTSLSRMRFQNLEMNWMQQQH